MTDKPKLRSGEEHQKEQPATTSTEKFFNDLSALRLDGTGISAGAKEVLSHIPVRKPNRHEFFRVHPEWALATTVFTNKEDRDEIYLVPPEMRVALLGEARPVLLAPAISRLGPMFVWPVSLPGEDGRRSPWAETAHEAMMLAREKWVRLTADMALGAYRFYYAEGQLPDPIWPDKSFEQILEIAFRDRIIKTEDHPVVRRLRGIV